MKTVFIYTFKDPDTGQIRYVGASVNPNKRFSQHLIEPDKNHRTNWIKSLKAAGMRPVLAVVDEVSEDCWQAAEAAYIQFYRELGCKLVNGSEGGQGGSVPGENHPCFGRKKSPEERAKIRASKLGKKRKPFSDECRIRMSDSHLGIFAGKKHPLFGTRRAKETTIKMNVTRCFNRVFAVCKPIE